MAAYDADFSVNFNFGTDNIILTDTTDYAGMGFGVDSTFKGYITSIIAPSGAEIYSNDPDAENPDIERESSSSSIREIPIAKLSDGSYQTGNYTIIFHATANVSDTFDAEKSFSVTYTKPTAELTVSHNCITPLFSSEDTTDYAQDGYTVDITRTHTVDFPKDGIADYVTSDAEIELDEFYSTVQTVSLSSDIVYTKGGLTLTDSIEISVEDNVICPEDLCQIYSYVNAIYDKYVEAEGTNTAHAQRLFKDLMIANTLLQLIRSAIACDESENLVGYAERIKDIADQYCADCECGELGVEPTLITGIYDVAISAGTEEEIVTNIAVGGIGSQTTIPEGTSYTDFVKMLTQTIYQPTGTAPSLSSSVDGSTSREVGESVTTEMTLTFNRGDILGDNVAGVWNPATVQNPRAGVATSYKFDGIDNGLVNSKTLNFTVPLGATTFTGKVLHGAGAQPLDSEGNNATSLSIYPSGEIETQKTFNGYYKRFWGTMASAPTTSAEIRALSNNAYHTGGAVFNLETGTTHRFFVVALPDGHTITDVTDISNLNAPYTSSYILSATLTQVEDASGALVNYNVYVIELDKAYDDSATHQITTT